MSITVKMTKQQVMIFYRALEHYTSYEGCGADEELKDWPDGDHQEALRLHTIFEYLHENVK
jgi:hypothetical protein